MFKNNKISFNFLNDIYMYMEEHGIIKAFGRLAVTIQSSNQQQYYAPFESLDPLILEQLIDPLPVLPVKFTVNKYKYSGETEYGKRYYAENVKLDLDF
tara:strand:- start:3310 stop:3603 length:294 start_codon:yes stop_codon:yes gene_type:complete